MKGRYGNSTPFAISAIVLTVAACGGGGGGGGEGNTDNSDTNGGSLTSDTAVSAARASYSTAASLAEFGSSQTDSYIRSAKTEGIRAASGLDGVISATVSAIRTVTGDGTTQSSNTEIIRRAQSDAEQACPGGGSYEVLTADDPDPERIETNDTFTVDFQSCVIDGTRFDNSFRVDMNYVENPGSVYGTSRSWYYSARILYDQWTIDSSRQYTIDGDVLLVYGYDIQSDKYESSVQNGPLTLTSEDSETRLSDISVSYDSSASGDAFSLVPDFSAEFNGSEFSGEVTVNGKMAAALKDDGTTTDDNKFPDTGGLDINDKSGNYIFVEAAECGSDSFQLTFVAAGGAVTATCETWME